MAEHKDGKDERSAFRQMGRKFFPIAWKRDRLVRDGKHMVTHS